MSEQSSEQSTEKSRSGLLDVHEAVVSYWRSDTGPVRAVAGVDLTVQPGEILGLVGETGCGKSSLARAIVGLVPLESGSIVFDGLPVGSLRRSSRPAGLRPLQMIFQDPSSSLNPRIRVGKQIENAVTLSTGSRKGRERARELLDQVGLPPTAAERFPHEFSGGQRQRISIARALAAEPRMIVADEPIAALDASAQAQIANLLVDLCRQLGLSLLFISHDLSIVRKIADNTAVMYLGRIVEKAPTAGPVGPPGSPLHQGADRSRAQGQCDRRTPRGATRRCAGSGLPASRVPVPPEMSDGDRQVPHRGPGGRHGASARRLLLAGRPPCCRPPGGGRTWHRNGEEHRMTTAWDYPGRRAALERRMHEQAVDLMFLPVSADLEYLTGLQRRVPAFGTVGYAHHWVAGALLAPGREPVFVLPRMITEFDLPEGVVGEVVTVNETDDGRAIMASVVGRFGEIGTLALGNRAWAESVIELTALCRPDRTVSAETLVNPLRRIKSSRRVGGDETGLRRRRLGHG